jgi:flagellar P-ring protein precursor FlgI
MIFSFNVRLKDISTFRGVRDNQLFGIGVVTGLDGKGDTGNIPSEMITNMIKNLGIELSSVMQTRNTALVMVYADIPAFYKSGMRIDVNVAAIGNSTSLENGVLIQTPLYGADRQVYAVAQGNVLTGGASVRGAANLQTNYRVVGSVPQGAIIEREIPTTIISEDTVTIYLNNPDITTASRVTMAINNTFSNRIARATDPSSIRVQIPELFYDDVISFLALIEEIEVKPDVKAKIIINEKTGTVVMGGNVKFADFTLSYGNFIISITNGEIGEKPATIDNVMLALRTAGALPQDVIAIFQNLSLANYIYADVVVM